MNTVPRSGNPRCDPAARGQVVNAEKENTGHKKATRSDSSKSAADLFDEVLEQKYNIEGCNTADVVYARRDNDKANATIAEQAAELERLKRLAQSFMAAGGATTNAAISGNGSKPAAGATASAPTSGSDIKPRKKDVEKKAKTTNEGKATAGSARTGTGTSASSKSSTGKRPKAGTEDAAALTAHQGDEEMETVKDADALAHENAELRRLLAAARGGAEAPTDDGPGAGSVPRPAGSTFNIQDAMGLGKGSRNRENYKTTQRYLRDLTLQAGVNWEKLWSEVTAETKGKMFAVARNKHLILERYHNDWATEAIIKQFLKNRRNTEYQNNRLEVPEKYQYLKTNAAKRDPTAPRGRQGKLAKAAAAKKRRKKAKASAQSTRKAKAKMVVESDDEGEDDNMDQVCDEDDDGDSDEGAMDVVDE
ncbi:hypothetical protein B0H13DRAFT_2376479 [Mycena leptocephala]|nr:hypothetical protein B0H13DRAFT_2376479 [Mycena leptocephala]